MFYLLLYAILKTDKISQRYLEDVFKSSHFKFLFNYSIDMKIRHSSISERLSKVDIDFFRQAYEAIYEEFNKQYCVKQQEQMNLIRVDSSMVAEASNKLQKGMQVGRKSVKDVLRTKSQAKYTMAYDGNGICHAKVFTSSNYLSEDVAIPEVIHEMLKADKDHRNLYVFDRGVSALDNFETLTKEKAHFICRIKTNRKREIISSLMDEQTEKDLDSLTLVSDDIVHLFDRETNRFSDTNYRLIIADRKEPIDTTPPDNKGKFKRKENRLFFLTNDFEASAKEITDYYKKRWDIEVFFRFIKQELNFKHFVSVNENGLQVMLYMTLIAAMLVMIYKKVNELGFTTAKRRMGIELEDIITAMTVLFCGGDISRWEYVDFRRPFPK